jgi:hypothetical protein
MIETDKKISMNQFNDDNQRSINNSFLVLFNSLWTVYLWDSMTRHLPPTSKDLRGKRQFDRVYLVLEEEDWGRCNEGERFLF